MSRTTAVITVILSRWIARIVTCRKSVGPHPRLVIGLSRARGQSSIPLRIGAPRIVDLECTTCSLPAVLILRCVYWPSCGRTLALIHSTSL